MILNTACSPEKVPTRLKVLFEYVHDGVVAGEDELVNDIQGKIDELKGKKEVQRIMTLYEDFQITKRIEREEGIEEGKALGIKEGKAIGLKEATSTIAKNLKNTGTDYGLISEATGLTIEEIKKL